MASIFTQEGFMHHSQEREQPGHQWQFESQSHAKHQHHEIVDVRIKGNLIFDSRTQFIGRKKTQRERINHEIAQQYAEEKHHRTDTKGFLHTVTLVRIERRTDKSPDFKENIRRSRHHRHQKSGGHVHKERGGQIDIDKFDMKFLRKEFIVKVKDLAYVTQQVIEDEIVVTGCQYYVIKQPRHCNEVTDSQYKPHTKYAKQHTAQFVQMVPKG